MERIVIRSEGGVEMVRWLPTGEVRVEDVESGTCSEWLHYTERDLPLGDYALDLSLEDGAD